MNTIEKPITIWRKWCKDEKGRTWHEHNHIEDGQVEGEQPQGHPMWKNDRWIKSFGVLRNSVVYKRTEH